jgi:protein-S-isoprenylcysteine O-methyltransferase Ste14
MPRASVVVVPLVIPDLLRAAAFLIRGQKFASLPGMLPKLASYAGGFAAFVLFNLFSYFRPQWTMHNDGAIATLGLLMLLLGIVLTSWAVWQLRHSFSIEPQARALVSSGPYGISRHPIYVLGFLQILGIWLSHRTVAVAVIALVSSALQCLRMYYEEQVLSNAFPEYDDYRKQVDIFGLRALRRIMKELFPSGNALPVHTTRG